MYEMELLIARFHFIFVAFEDIVLISMDPVSILNTIYEVTMTIKQSVKQVKANEKQCKTACRKNRCYYVRFEICEL